MWWLVLLALSGCDALLRLDDVAPVAADADLSGIAVSQGLVAYYRFDELADVPPCARDAVGTHDATCTGGTPTIVAGQVGSAIELDGTTAMTVAHANDLDATQGLTVAAWVRVEGIPDTYNACIVNRAVAASDADAWQICAGPTFNFYAVGSAQMMPPPFAMDEWHHVAVTWDGTTASAWLDGSAIANMPTAAPAYDMLGVYIGVDLDSTGLVHYFKGAIDDLRIYDRALSPGEIAMLLLVK